jgi:hypothetical protein
VILHRYVIRMGSVATAEPSALQAWLGDRIQRLLDSAGPGLADPVSPRGGATPAAPEPGQVGARPQGQGWCQDEACPPPPPHRRS